MRRYQFFRMDRQGARAEVAAEPFADDAAAIRYALGADFPYGSELWDGFRFLGQFYGGQSKPAPAAETPPEAAVDLKPAKSRLLH
ncbi:hypothetical protein DJ021_13745 [Phenylobacterium hankyongense]|uniref:Uncharacterized protein n=1 Tax=Phenylobacterium hankyongense TaxID=1813876 RepID=A0A328B4L2_9CAUL|nr:hypothetical protein [Phenylobacterium hankyongense]RAK60794.1 hypothetical protein DJ021_13745 [Phenylobacterium hankyongense]